MVNRFLIDYIVSLQDQKSNKIKVKILIDDEKINTQRFYQKALIKNLIPTTLIDYQLYTLDLYYKDRGIYYSTSLKNLYFVKIDDKILFFESKSIIFESKYLRTVSDYEIFGKSKKKIDIKTIKNTKLFQIDIYTDDNDHLFEEDSKILNEKSKRSIWIVGTDCNFEKEVQKALKDYIYIIMESKPIFLNDSIVIVSFSVRIIKENGIGDRIARVIKKIFRVK